MEKGRGGQEEREMEIRGEGWCDGEGDKEREREGYRIGKRERRKMGG